VMQGENDTTIDDFLGGRVSLQQPKRGFRSGHDAVLLAASLAPSDGQHIGDLGTGSGAAALCLLARHPACQVTGLERQPDMAALARNNAQRNQAETRFHVIEADVTGKQSDIGVATHSFDAVMANPPYFTPDAIRQLPDASKQQAFAAAPDDLALWVKRACALVRANGEVSFIYRADQLVRLLAAIDGRLGGVFVQPVAPKPDAAASRVVVRGQRDSRAPLTLLPPLVLQGADGQPSPAAEQILRHGAALAFARTDG